MVMVDKAKKANLTFAKGLSYLWNLSKKNDLDRFGFKKAAAHLIIVGGIPCLLSHDNEILMIGSVTLGSISTIHAWQNEYKEKSTTYGDARFAKTSEIKKAGMIGKTGLFFGKDNGKFAVKKEDMEGHVIVLGPTGVGKTAGYVIPSLWRWKDSALVFDPKGGELVQKTGIYRGRFQKVYSFNPFGEHCDCYNPIEHCRTPNEAVSMAQVLIPEESKQQAYWEEMTRSIVAAAIYEGHLNGRTLTEVCKFICLNDVDYLKEYYLNHPNDKVKLLAANLRHLKDKNEIYIMSDLIRSLNMLAMDDHIERATSRSDWDLNELEDRSTIYLSIPEEELKLPQYRKLLNVIINQAVDQLSRRKEMKKDDPDDKRPRILFMIDELPTLGHVPSLLQSLATLRSRGIILSLAFQAFSQIDELYGVNGRKTIMNTCRYKLVLGIEDPDTAKYFSDLVGDQTIKTRNIGRNNWDDQYNINESETGVPLIRPSNWKDLDDENVTILIGPMKHPFKLEKIKYWKDASLKRMMRVDLVRFRKKRELQESVQEHMEEIAGFEELPAEKPERREAK